MDEQLRQHIERLREDFSKDTLDEGKMYELPADQFRHWMQQAVEARIIELQAMTLSTVSAEGKPSARIVYLREFGEDRFTFYTNYESKKARDLETNPHAALTFFWPHLERQVRIEGTVVKAPAQTSDAYFQNRPYESQIGAWASKQSAALQTREQLEEQVRSLSSKMKPGTVQRPEFWGGLTLVATYYEFWQGRKSRLHDRISYTKEENTWRRARLSP